MDHPDSLPPTPDAPHEVSRRGFLAIGGAAGSVLLTGQQAFAAVTSTDDNGPRRQPAFAARRDAARAYLSDRVEANLTNGDEARYADRRASFAKTLPHDELGEVDRAAFARFVSTLQDGRSDPFDHLVRDPQA